jgi:CheY-like chemotaxis protein
MGRSGTGLGMAVVWGTVKDHKGYIDLQSTEGQGTTVALYFPVTREALVDSQAAEVAVYSNGNGEKVLVVDDIEEQRQIATLMLRKLGYDARAVSGGAEAIEFLQGHSADLIVLDMIMDPGIDGLETFKQILRIHPGQKAIIASGFSETWRVKKAQRLGAGAYVKKPYTLENIEQAVSAELGK